MNIIKNYGFLTSDPLILFLEIKEHVNIITKNKIKNIILNTVGKKLLNNKYKLNYIKPKLFSNEQLGMKSQVLDLIKKFYFFIK